MSDEREETIFDRFLGDCEKQEESKAKENKKYLDEEAPSRKYMKRYSERYVNDRIKVK